MKKGLPSPRPRLPCPSCPFITPCRTSLARHLARHSPLRPHPCSLCPLSFKLKSILVRHVLRRHTDHKPNASLPAKAFSCAHCPFSTAYKGNLKDHLGRHSQDLLACNLCDYKTKSLKNLSKHRLHHVQGKRFVCSVCPYATNERASLTKHAALHTGERRVACGACGYSTSDNSNMTRHRRLYCKVSTTAQTVRQPPAAPHCQLMEPAPAGPDNLLVATDAITRECLDSKEAAVTLTVDTGVAVSPRAVSAVDCRPPGRNRTPRIRYRRRSLPSRGTRRLQPVRCPGSAPDTLCDGRNHERTIDPDGAQNERVSVFNRVDAGSLGSAPLLRALEKVPLNISSHLPLYPSFRKDDNEPSFVEIAIEVHPEQDLISRALNATGPARGKPPQCCRGESNSSPFDPSFSLHDSSLDASVDFKEILLMPLEDCDAFSNKTPSCSLLRRNLTCLKPLHLPLNDTARYAALNSSPETSELTEAVANQTSRSSHELCSINLAADYSCENEAKFSILDISSGTLGSFQSSLTRHDLTEGEVNELVPCHVPTLALAHPPARFLSCSEEKPQSNSTLVKNFKPKNFVNSGSGLSVASCDGFWSCSGVASCDGDGPAVSATNFAADVCGGRRVPTVAPSAGASGQGKHEAAVVSSAAPAPRSQDALMSIDSCGSRFDCVLNSQSVGTSIDGNATVSRMHPLENSNSADITNPSPSYAENDSVGKNNLHLHHFGYVSETSTDNIPLASEQLIANVNSSPGCWPHSCAICAVEFSSLGLLIQHNLRVHNLMVASSSQSLVDKEIQSFSSVRVHETVDPNCFDRPAPQVYEGVDIARKTPFKIEFQKSKYAQKCALDELRHSCTRKNTSKKLAPVIPDCGVCGFRANKKRLFRAHCKTHRCEKPFNCSLCSFSTKYKNSLKMHVRLKHEPKTDEPHKAIPEVLKCRHCDFTSTHASSLRRHLKRHSLNDSEHCPQLRCQYCGQLFGDRLSLLHHSASHSDEKRFACTICGYRTEFTRILKAHVARHLKKTFPYDPDEFVILQHTNIPPVAKERKSALQCKLCPYTCRNRSSLSKHRTKAHPNHGSIHCPVCFFRCDDQKSLLTHTRAHVNELPHECGSCGHRCRTRYLLNKHEKRHSNERTIYSCQKCSFTTSTKSSIILHMKYHPEMTEYTSLRMEPVEEGGCVRAFRDGNDETASATITVITASRDGDNEAATATITVNSDS